ncbi:hypothetical protein Esti_002027 [Eimeria stiedai]
MSPHAATAGGPRPTHDRAVSRGAPLDGALVGQPLRGPPSRGPFPLEDFGTGQLVSIFLNGYMAFKSPVEVFFSPYTNLVASCNGVGKSTVVSAIQFALGCRSSSSSSSIAAAAALGQQQQQQLLQRHLTYGGSKASVCLFLKGTFPGELVAIRRDLEKTGKSVKSVYHVNGQEARLSEVQRQCERLSLRVDNYLCFMQQDKVSLFGLLTPKELLANTLQAINEEDFRCLRSLQQQQEKLQQLLGAHETLRDKWLLLLLQQQVLKRQQQQLVDHYNLKRHLALCQGRILRLHAEEAVEGYRRAKGELNAARAALEPQMRELDKQKETVAAKRHALQQKEEAFRKQMRQAAASKDAVQANLDKINAKQQLDEETAAELDRIPAKLQSLKRRMQLQREKALDPQAKRLMLEETLQQMRKRKAQQQQQEQEQASVKQQGDKEEQQQQQPLQLPATAAETEKLLQQQTARLEQLRLQSRDTAKRLRSTQGALREATDRLAFMQRLQQQRQQQLALQQQQQQQQQRQQVLQALARLETGLDVGSVSRGMRLLQTKSFRAPVEGPLGAIVAVTEGPVVSVAEHFLRPKLLSYLCVDPEQDFHSVSSANLRCFALNPNLQVSPRPQLTAALRAAGVKGFLSDFLVVPAAVRDTFLEYTRAHLCLVCRGGLTAREEQLLQQTAKAELRRQGCLSQEIVFYSGQQAHRIRSSMYDPAGFVHVVVPIPRKPPILRLHQQHQQQQQQGEGEQELQQERQQQEQQQLLQQQIERLREAEQRLAAEQRQLETEETREREARRLLRGKLLVLQAEREEETELQQRIAAAAAEAAAQDKEYRALAAQLAAEPAVSVHLKQKQTARFLILRQQLQLLAAAAEKLQAARKALAPFKLQAAVLKEEAVELGKDDERIQQIHLQLEKEQQKIVELRETVQQRRAAYGDAKSLVEAWKRDTLGVYRELLHLLQPAAAADAAEETARAVESAEALLASDMSSSTTNSSSSSRRNAASVLSPSPPLPESAAELEALEARLKLQLERCNKVDTSPFSQLAKNAAEAAAMQTDMQETRREALALHESMQQQTLTWLPHLESMMSVLSLRFRALMKSVSPQANGEVRLIAPRAFTPSADAAAGGDPAPQQEETPKRPLVQQLSPLPDYSNLRLSLKVTFGEAAPLRQLSNMNSGGERSLVAVLYLLAVQAFAKGSFRVLDEINQGLDSAREALLFSLLSRGRRAAFTPQSALAAAAAAPGDTSSSRSKKRQAQCLEDSNSGASSSSGSSSSKRQRSLAAPAAPASAAASGGESETLERQKEGQVDSVEETGDVQYILLTPHMVQEADLSSICLQFVFSGPGAFTQEQLNIHDQLNRLRAKRKRKPKP